MRVHLVALGVIGSVMEGNMQGGSEEGFHIWLEKSLLTQQKETGSLSQDFVGNLLAWAILVRLCFANRSVDL